jgi:hypothetical protein
VQSPDHILNTYDERISKYAEEKFARDGGAVQVEFIDPELERAWFQPLRL